MIKVYFDDVLIDTDSYVQLDNDYKLFTDSFKLGSVASDTFSLGVIKNAVSTHPINVRIEDDTTIFNFVVDKIVEDDNVYTYSLTDKLLNFNFEYDASILINDKATNEEECYLSDIWKDICNQANVEYDETYVFENDIVVNWYDNRIQARRYLSFIAELQSGYACMLDNGKQSFKKFNRASVKTIDADECSDLIVGEKKKITRVVYDGGAFKWEFGDDTGDTLYLQSDNVFIVNEDIVENIYNNINGFEFYIINCPQAPMDSTVKAGDVITFNDNGTLYPTIAQYSMSYAGSWSGGYKLQVNTERQQETQIRSTKDTVKSIKTEVDRANASLKIVAEEIETLTPSVEKSVKSTKVQYYLSTSNVSPTGSSWSDTAPEWEEDKYMFTRTTTTLNDNTVVYSPSANGTLLEGLKGKDGESGTSSYTYIRYSKNADGTGFTSTPQVDTEYIGIAVTSSAIAPTLKGDYTWSKYVGQDGTSGEDGASIWSTTVAPVTPNYTFTKTNLTGPVGVEIKSGDIILYSYYRYTITTISSTTVLAPTRVSIRGATGAAGTNGTNGEDGRGITNSTITYQLHTNGTTAPTGSWLSNPPTPEQGKYLWTKTVLTYTDSSNSTTYSVSYYATDGQNGTNGKGISTTEIKYQIHTSGTSAPTGTWLDNPPTPEKGKYLWTRTKITYTDATNSTTYSVSYYATDGQKGDTGTGIVSITAQYYKSTSSSTQTGGSWSSTPPTYEKNKYLWFRNEIVYKNPTSTEYTTPQLDTTWEEIGAVETRTASLEVRTGDIEGNVEDLIDLTNFVKTASGTTTNFQIPNTPKSNGAINTLSIKKIPFMALYPGMAYPSETTYPGALTFYTLVFDTTASFNNTPSYVYINSPIALRILGSTYDEILIENNKVKIIQRVSLNGSLVLGSPITHNLGDVILPTFDGNTYVKLLYFTNLIWNVTYITKNDYSEVFATQLESSSQFKLNQNEIEAKVNKDGIISSINLSPEEIKILAEKIKMEGLITANDNFKILLDGSIEANKGTFKGDIFLPDGGRVIGGDGILGSMQFSSFGRYDGVGWLGYAPDTYHSGFTYYKKDIPIVYSVPNNFTPILAYVTIQHTPIVWDDFGTERTGYSRNIRLYKATSNSFPIYYMTYAGGYLEDLTNNLSGTEISNAFGSAGFTGGTTVGIVTNQTSIDIASSLTDKNGTLFLRTANSVTQSNTDCTTRTGMARATLFIIGYTSIDV